MLKKLFAIIMALVMLACFNVNSFAVERFKLFGITHPEAITEDGQLKPGIGGQYWYCTKHEKFFTLDSTECPYCGSKLGEDEFGYAGFECAAFTSVWFFKVCPHCQAADGIESDRIENLTDPNYEWWVYGYNKCCRCGKDLTWPESSISPLAEPQNWCFFEGLYNENTYFTYGEYVSEDGTHMEYQKLLNYTHDEAVQKMKAFWDTHNYKVVNNPDEPDGPDTPAEPGFFEKIINWFVKIFNAIAQFVNSLF